MGMIIPTSELGGLHEGVWEDNENICPIVNLSTFSVPCEAVIMLNDQLLDGVPASGSFHGQYKHKRRCFDTSSQISHPES